MADGEITRQAFHVAYVGESADDHSMDVEALAPALLAFGKLVRAANREINGDRASVKDQEGTPDSYVVRVGNEEIVFQVGVWIEARAEADFSFQIYDSIDKDYVSLGGAHATVDTNFSSSLLVTIIGDFFGGEPAYDVETVELLDIPRSIDFGEVNPDFSDDRD